MVQKRRTMMSVMMMRMASERSDWPHATVNIRTDDEYRPNLMTRSMRPSRSNLVVAETLVSG